MIKNISSILLISIILALLTDFFLGEHLLKFTPKKINQTVSHNIYDHDLKKNFKANP